MQQGFSCATCLYSPKRFCLPSHISANVFLTSHISGINYIEIPKLMLTSLSKRVPSSIETTQHLSNVLTEGNIDD